MILRDVAEGGGLTVLWLSRVHEKDTIVERKEGVQPSHVRVHQKKNTLLELASDDKLAGQLAV